MLAIDPRPGGATSNCAADNIALLDLAVSRLPGRYRRRVLVRLDGAGFSHELLSHIAAGGNTIRHVEERRRLDDSVEDEPDHAALLDDEEAVLVAGRRRDVGGLLEGADRRKQQRVGFRGA